MSEFTPLAQSEFFTAQAEQSFVVPPTLRISSVLGARVIRHGRTLDVDESVLLEGIKEIEVERPSIVNFDSIPKDSDSITPGLSFTWPRHETPSEATLRINPNLTADHLAKGADKQLNAAFWSGVLVTEALNEGKGDQYLSERENMKKTPWRERIIPFMGGLGLEGILEYGDHMHTWSAVPIGIAVQVAAATAYYMRRNRMQGMDINIFVAKKHASKAQELADAYPVLSEGYLLG